MNDKRSMQGEKNQNIKVYVRCRPINEQERKARSQMCVEVAETRRTITVKSHHEKTFTFDGTFGKDSTQIDVYKSVVQPLISEVLQGYNCTVFAYGQTGTGKTYTMEGVRSQTLLSWQHDPHAGVVPRALHQIFSEVGDPELTIIKVSFLELYNEELFDLLGSGETSTSKLKIFEDSTAKGSVVVRGLEEVVVRDREEVYSLMERGAARRQVAATLMNASSSRSHTIFTITVISRDTMDSGENLMRTGKLNLVDLAGSENIGRSGAQDKRAREAGNINQSLLTLGRVITALVERTPHIPYRESKLTRLLQDSLGGRTKTSIIATISPAQVNLDETLSTLEYAFRAKNIMNRPEVNQKLCEGVVIKHMTDEMEQLRRDLRACREKNGIYIDETNYKSMQSRLDLQSEELQRNTEEMIEMASRIDSLKNDIDLLQELSRATNEKLERETRTRELAQTRLREVNYKYTATKVIAKAHQETEEKLHEHASKLIDTALLAKSDTHKLHEKVQRQREVESHNAAVIEKLSAVLSSSIDSSVRRAEDAIQTFTKSCSLKDETLKGLREEIGLLQDVDCLLGTILQKHLTNRERILEKISRINHFASDSIQRLNHMETQFDDSLTKTLSGVTSKLCFDLTDELSKLKNSLRGEVAQITEVASTTGHVLSEECERLSSFVETSKRSALERAARAEQESQAMRVKQANICETLERLNQHIDRELKKVNEDIHNVFTPQNKFLHDTQEDSKTEVGRIEQACGTIDSILQKQAQASSQIVSHAENIRMRVEECEEKQQNITHVCVENIKSDFVNLKELLVKNNQITNKNLTGSLQTGEETASAFKRDSSGAIKDLTTLADNILSGNKAIVDAKDKLTTLRENVNEMIRGNVKSCPVTGSTPARREYDIPRSLARTQPENLLRERLQKKFEEATLEERMALDEGQSILLDVTATPETLDFDSDEENNINILSSNQR